MSELSDILVSDVITELGINKTFSERDETEKLEMINTVSQIIAGWYIDKEKDEYKDNTLGGI